MYPADQTRIPLPSGKGYRPSQQESMSNFVRSPAPLSLTREGLVLTHNAGLPWNGKVYSAAATRVAPCPRNGDIGRLDGVLGDVIIAVTVRITKVSGHRSARRRLFIAGSGVATS